MRLGLRIGRLEAEDRARIAMRVTNAAAILMLPLAVAACGGPDGPSKADTGLAVGAIAGGILGNQVGKGSGRIAATAIGAVIGGIVGSEIGRSLDQQDKILAQRAELDALERGRSGERIPWRNPDSGRYGEVYAGAPFRRGPEDCREYTHRVFIEGRPQTMKGVACRNPDGTWRNVG
jgi:surface antigen